MCGVHRFITQNGLFGAVINHYLTLYYTKNSFYISVNILIDYILNRKRVNVGES